MESESISLDRTLRVRLKKMPDANKKQSNEQSESMENVQELLLSAQQGDAEAQFKLGRAYYNGEGVAQDYKQAVKWWKKAAVQGMVLAQNSLGQAYYDGKGIRRNYNQAIKLFRKAAERGLAEAQYNLGATYHNFSLLEESIFRIFFGFVGCVSIKKCFVQDKK